jgi:glycosyltransferase involved in cell wall biosynthesis
MLEVLCFRKVGCIVSFTRWVAGAEWLLALAWFGRSVQTWYHLGEVPNLLDPLYAGAPGAELSVIVPALNEAEAIGACLHSLLGSQGIRLEILAVDDRSTDNTGAIMESVALEAAGSGHSLRVIHIAALPDGWLGKPHALAIAAAEASAPYLLFTDADGVFAPDALARAMRLVEVEAADHFVLLPSLIHKSAGERMMLSGILTLSMWGVRLWKIADPRARDSIGVGCFNLVRREAFEAIGGFEALRMEVVEDLRLGFLIKQRGLRQRVAFGPGLLQLYWASGAGGIVRNLTKNTFAVYRYRLVLFLAATCGVALLTLAPVAGLFGPASVRVPSVLTLLIVLACYTGTARRTRIPAGYAVLYPVAIVLLLYAMLRSAAVTLARGGVLWRGTFYPLRELRQNAGPLWRLRRKPPG